MKAPVLKAASVTLLSVFFLTGCASPSLVSFQTKKDPAYQDKLGKILVVTQDDELTAQLEKQFLSRLLTQLTGSLAQRNVPSEIVQVNKSDLDPYAPVKAVAERFRPQQLLYLAVTRVMTRTESRYRAWGTGIYVPQTTSVSSIAITYTIQDKQSGKTIWRGEAKFDPPPHPEDIAESLLKQLETEKLL